jgi:hypothetical protein
MSKNTKKTAPDAAKKEGAVIAPPPKGHKSDDERLARLERDWRRLKDRGRRWTPWLVLRYTLADIGLRPIPAAEPFWVSPDIRVESSDPLGRPVAGEENFVHAKIFNLGKADAMPTRVDFYWADPSLGLGPATMNLIGTEWVEVDHGSAVDVRCSKPWVPVMLNGGHECLMVHCSSAIMDPIQAPFQPRVDRHVGQRNVHVIEATPGQIHNFNFVVNNLFTIATRALVTAQVFHLDVSARALRELPFPQVVNHLTAFGAAAGNTPEALLARYRAGTTEHRLAAESARWFAAHALKQESFVRSVQEPGKVVRSAACVAARWHEHSCIVKQPGGRGLLAAALCAGEKLAHDGPEPDHVCAETPLKPFEQRRLAVDIEVPTGAKKGEFLVYHFAQRVEDLVVGGYTVVVKVVGHERERRA